MEYGAACGVMEYGAAGIAESLVCDGSATRLVGQLVWSYEGNNSIRVHGGSRMDCFKMECIFAKVEFVRYVYSFVTLRLELYLGLG
jgi:hypothetical protein